MFSYQYVREDVVVVEEKIKLNPQFFKVGDDTFDFATPPGGFSLKIQRNLRDDTFNMVFKDVYKKIGGTIWVSGDNEFKPFANIDGTDVNIGAEHVLVNNKNPNSFFVHRSMISNAVFREAKSISVGIKHPTYDVSYRMSIYPQFETLKDSVRISEHKILDFKTVNGITISTKEGDFGKRIHFKEDKLNIKKSYSHTFLVPRELNRMGKNVTVFDAYIYNEKIAGVDMPGTEDPEADVSLHEGKIKTTSFKKILSLVVNDIQSKKMNEYKNITKEMLGRLASQRRSGEHSPIEYIGSFNMFDQTSYDYEKGISVVGSSSTSREGEIIPYSLKGGYFRESTLGVNEIYKKIKILQTFTNQKPILQPDAGKVRLNIESNLDSPKKEVTLYDIDPKILIKQKDYIFPLEGLERIRKEHGVEYD